MINYGSASFGLLTFVILTLIQSAKKIQLNLSDLLVVGLAGSTVPTGLLLIYSVYDKSVLYKISDAGTYIAFAGAALIIIFLQTFKAKLDHTSELAKQRDAD